MNSSSHAPDSSYTIVAGNSSAQPVSAVSWGAILAGAAVAAALSLILLVLGTGLGLSSVSPWTRDGPGAQAFGIGTVLWLSFMQFTASGMGGYITGRLRVRWPNTDDDEVFFRDTAHGFLAWAIAALAMATLLAAAAGRIIDGAASASTAVSGTAMTASIAEAATAASTARDTDRSSYFIDTLFQQDASAGDALDGGPMPPKVTAAVLHALSTGSLDDGDREALRAEVVRRNGLSTNAAEQRIDDAIARLQTSTGNADNVSRELADVARKASAKLALWLFATLLLGAFVASLTAVLGGRQRDR